MNGVGKVNDSTMSQSTDREDRWTLTGGPEPLHLQVRTALERALRRGDFPLHRPIPSSRLLAENFGVSRTTILTALDRLVAVGLLTSRPRSGLYPVPTLGAGASRSPDSGQLDAPPVRVAAGVEWSDHLLCQRDPWEAKSVSDPDFASYPFPFLPGQPLPEMFPVRAWLRASSQVFDRPHIVHALRDSADADDPFLVEALIAHVLRHKGIEASPEQVLITSGVQQGLSLLAGALLDRGRTVAVEDPGYVDAARIFSRTGARIQLLPVDAAGASLGPDTDVDAVFVTPGHQHPTNATMSASRRAALLGQAEARDFIIIEDDFDTELRFRGVPTLPMRANDKTGRVVYLGTFSKFLAPALRLGYVVAEPPVIAELRERRYLATKHPSGLDQRALAIFIASGEYDRALGKHRRFLKRNWELVRESLDRHFPWQVEDVPTGGLSLWITGPPGFDSTLMASRARELGVVVIPGERYYLRTDPPRTSFRLGFNSITPDRIDEGIRLLSLAARETHDLWR